MKFLKFGWAGMALLAVLLSGCNPSSDDGSNSGNNNNDGGNDDLSTIQDPHWNAGSDAMLAVRVPANDVSNGKIFALVKGNNQRLLSANRSDSTFSSATVSTAASYSDMIAFRVTQTDSGTTETNYVIVACAKYSSSAYFEMFLASNPNDRFNYNGVSGLTNCNHLAPYNNDSSNGSNLSFSFTGTNSSGGTTGVVSFNTDLFGAQVNKGTSSDVFYGISNSVRQATNPTFRTQAITMVSGSTEFPVFASVDTSTNTNHIFRRPSTSDSAMFSSTTNPFTDTTSQFNVTGMTYVSGEGLYFVGTAQGMVGFNDKASPSTSAFVKLSDAPATRCIDALTSDSSKLWCHDATSTGRIIGFDQPTIPVPSGGGSAS